MTTEPGITYTLLIDRAPAPASVIDAIQEIEVESSIDLASIFRVRFGTSQSARTDPGWTILDGGHFPPLKPITVRVDLGGGPLTLINGYTSGSTTTFSDEPGRSVLEVVGMDATLLMNLEEKVRAWSNLADSDIAEQILDQYSSYRLSADVRSTPGSLKDPEGTPTQRGTDMRLLRRLAQRHGFECYVQPSGDTADLVYFGPPQVQLQTQAVLTVGGGQTNNVSELRISYDMLRPTTAQASSLDTASKQPQPVTITGVSVETQGVKGTLDRIPTPPLVRPAQTGLVHTQELTAMAQGLVDRASWAVMAEGLVGPDVGVLRPGRPITVRGAGRLLSGSYYVTRVTHQLGGQGYVQRFQARRNTVQSAGTEDYREPEDNVA